MTAGPVGVDDADSVVLPFSVTISSPPRRSREGMSRLEPTRVVPANGWPGTRSVARGSGFSFARWLGIPSARGREISKDDAALAKAEPSDH